MKKFRKIIIVLALSFYLTAVITPQRDKEAHAFILTGSIALGALAVAGVGAISYANRDHIAKLGQNIASKLQNEGVDVNEMLATNEYGLNKSLTDKMYQSIRAEQENYFMSGNSVTVSIPANSEVSTPIPETYKNNFSDTDKIAITSDKIYPKNELAMKLKGSSMEVSTHDFRTGTHWSNDIIHGLVTLRNYTSNDITITLTFSKNLLAEEMQSFHNSATWGDLGNITDTQGHYTNLYGSDTVSIDYDRLEDIMTNADSQPITADNISTLVSGLQDSIEDAGADTVGVLTTIWNGIKNIPSLIQSSSAAALGGISDLGTDLLSGLLNLGDTITGALSNGIDNITQANDQLWTDAGVIWSGMTNAINNGIANVQTTMADNTAILGRKISDWGSSIIDSINNLKTSATDRTQEIGDAVTGVFIPSVSMIDSYKARITNLNNQFKKKFEFITLPISSFGQLFSQPKSLYDVTMNLQGQTIHVLPENFRSSVTFLRPILTGVIVMLTFIGIYKKIQGAEVV